MERGCLNFDYLLIEEHVVLWAHPHRLTNVVHVSTDILPIDQGCSFGRREKSGKDGPV